MAETDASESSAAAEPLAPDERAELERLRDEVRTLRTSAHRRRRAPDWRSVCAAVLITLGCVLAPLSLLTVWTHNQVSDTDRFVTTVSPLIENPSVQATITDRLTETIFEHVDVRGLANQAVDALAAQGVPPLIVGRLHDLTGPLADGVRNFVHDRIAELVANPQVHAAWNQAVRVAHEQANAVLSGSAAAVIIVGDTVRLDLAPFITVAKQQLAATGFTAVNRVPDVHPTIAIGDARTLIQARSIYNTLNRLATWLPWITLALLAAGVYVAHGHRRALVATGFGVAAGMVVVAIGLHVVRAVLIGNVPSRSVAPVSASYDILVRFLRDGLRMVFVVALIIAIGAFLTGPSPTAVRVRGALSSLVAWLRRGGMKAGLRTGPLGSWVHAHRKVLRVTAVLAATLVFLFLSPPSGIAALVITLVLVGCLGVIQLLDQPAEIGDRQASGEPS